MLSIVIPAHNEQALLPATLRSAFRSGESLGGEFEVVVADDASTDRTAEIARAAGAAVVSIDRRQIAAARNAGAAATRGDVLVFLDADTLLPPRTLKAALAALERGAVGGGAQIRMDGRLPLMAKFALRTGMTLLRTLHMSGGCFLFATRKAFDAVGGFDERFFASEECWFCRSMARQGRVVILREPVITSARKVRDFSTRQILGTLLRLGLAGPKGLESRKGLEIWYEAPRE